ncbi:MAG: DUF5667 domain-containing protein [Patescibacteria group bacterium]
MKVGQRGFVPVAAVMVIAGLLAGGGAAAAVSAGAAPGDALYPVKQATESIEVAAAFRDESKARAHLRIADAKLDEVETLVADQAPADRIEEALDRLEEARQKAEEKISEMASDGKDVEELQALLTTNLERQQAVLGDVLERVPEQAQEAVQRAIDVSRQGLERAGQRVEQRGGSDNGKGDGVPPTTPSRGDARDTSDRQDSAGVPAQAERRGR